MRWQPRIKSVTSLKWKPLMRHLPEISVILS
jgi:hypothetical protein